MTVLSQAKRPLIFVHEKRPTGWCSLCKGSAPEGVYIRNGASGGVGVQGDAAGQLADEDGPVGDGGGRYYYFCVECVTAMEAALKPGES